MAEATPLPNVRTPIANRDDLQKLIPNNIRLLRALEQLFIDVNTTLPDAIQTVGDNSQAVTEDVSMGVFGATDRAAARTLTALADVLGRTDQDRATIKRLSARIGWLEAAIENQKAPVKPRIEAFIAPTLLNSWADFGFGRNPTGYFKDPFGVVHLRGVIKSGTVGNPVFTLPAGYRPAFQELLAIVSNGAIGIIDVNTNGNVTVNTGNNAYVSLDGLTFRAA